MVVVGRVCCDANGKLNAQSVILEGSLDLANGQTVKLDLSEVSQFALFPGQVWRIPVCCSYSLHGSAIYMYI